MGIDLDKKHEQLLAQLNKLYDKIALRGYVEQLT